MNLKRADCCRPKYRRFAHRIFSVNRRRYRHLRHRRSPLLRCPRFPSHRTCRNCPKTSCHRRTRTRDSSRRRWSRCWCRNRRSLHAQAGHCGSAPCASRGSKSPTSRRPLLRMPSFRSSWRPWFRAAAGFVPAMARHTPFVANEAGPFIDHLSKMWNFCRDRPLRCCPFAPCSTRKVRP